MILAEWLNFEIKKAMPLQSLDWYGSRGRDSRTSAGQGG